MGEILSKGKTLAMDLSRLEAFCRQNAMALDQSQLDAFVHYADTLYRLNEVMNLTRVPRDECEVRHFIDSLLVVEFFPANATVLDIGTGPGLPAWPIACARRDFQVTAVDSNGKMLRVLQECPLANLRVEQARAEELRRREAFEVVTGRAVAPLSVQLEISAAWCRVGGVVVPFRTPNEDFGRDFAMLGLSLESVEERALPHTDVVRSFPIYRKVAKTAAKYPRNWAQIKANPL
jgi:16S rRNA (guanine527-N7)-methyltransferase